MSKSNKNIKPYTKRISPVKKARQGVLQYEGGMMEGRKPDFEIGFEGNSSFSGYGHVTNGSAGIVEEVNPQYINLKSFEIKNTLNPSLWKNNSLNKKVRLKLLDIADEFINSLKLGNIEISDITLTGSLANYNWSKKYSDIDLHIILDYNIFDINKDILKTYFNSQRKIWNIDNKDVKIMGYPVEIYVQDINEPHKSSGVYSLKKDKWVVKPERSKISNEKFNDDYIKEKISEYINLIDKIKNLYKKYKSKDKVKLEKLLNYSEKLFDSIKNERKNALSKENGNEMSDGNIIFKSLRRANYIEKLKDLIKKMTNIINSIE